MLTVALSSAGEMGSAIGARLVEHGATVFVDLEGRSGRSRERARATGLQVVSADHLITADILLSILPPASAIAYARSTAAFLSAMPNPNLTFVDCNAINPDTALQIAQIIEAVGAGFADASIVGFPPKPGGTDNPVIFVSGPAASRVAELNGYGLNIRLLEAPVGAASAVKMCYGGLTKGLMGLAAALILAADRVGATEALRAELIASQPQLYPWLERMIPNIFTKSQRWVAEMNEVTAMLGDRPEHLFFSGAAGLFERIAEEQGTSASAIPALKAFFAKEG